MRTTCPRRAQTLGDSGTMIPILKMHLEITHAITGDIELTRRSAPGTEITRYYEPSQDSLGISLATPAHR